MVSVKFILISGPGAKPSQRQTELQRSNALSHAAKISHARRKNKREQGIKTAAIGVIANDCTSYRGDFPQDELDTRIVMSCPRTLVGQGKLDPFRSGQFEELPPIMHEGMEYVYEVLWPVNSPALEGQSLKGVINAWRSKAVASPLIFHSQVVNAATLCYVLASNPATRRDLEVVRLVHQTKAIRLVQEAINCLGPGIPSVALITCIMDMSVSGGQILDIVPVEPIPESPIAQAFNFKHYGRFAAPRAHFDAVIDLVHRRGGIEELPPEVANPLQLADIDVAIRLIARPIFPLRLSLLKLAREKKCRFDTHATALQGVLGVGFHRPNNIIQTSKLRLLITQACNLTTAIDQNHRGVDGKFRLHELALQAIVFEHRLLTLPQAWNEAVDIESPIPTVEEHIDEITRLTLMIFSAMVIFPSCPAARVKQRLSGLLRTRLVSLFESHGISCSAYEDLLLWAFILGGVACLDDTTNRAWYASQISQHVSRRGLSWDSVDSILHSFLYWDYVMAEPVAILWDEVTRLQGQDTAGLDLAAVFAQACAVDGLGGGRATVPCASKQLQTHAVDSLGTFHLDPSEGLPVAMEVGAVLYDEYCIWGRPE